MIFSKGEENFSHILDFRHDALSEANLIKHKGIFDRCLGALVDRVFTNNAEFIPVWRLVVKECFYSAGKTIPSLKMTPKGMKLFHCIVWGALQHHLKWALLSVTLFFINPEQNFALLHFYLVGFRTFTFSFSPSGCLGAVLSQGMAISHYASVSLGYNLCQMLQPVVGGDGTTMGSLTVRGRWLHGWIYS